MYYGAINVSHRKGISNTNDSRQCKICHCRYSFSTKFSFQ